MKSLLLVALLQATLGLAELANDALEQQHSSLGIRSKASTASVMFTESSDDGSVKTLRLDENDRLEKRAPSPMPQKKKKKKNKKKKKKKANNVAAASLLALDGGTGAGGPAVNGTGEGAGKGAGKGAGEGAGKGAGKGADPGGKVDPNPGKGNGNLTDVQKAAATIAAANRAEKP